MYDIRRLINGFVPTCVATGEETVSKKEEEEEDSPSVFTVHSSVSPFPSAESKPDFYWMEEKEEEA